MKAPLTEFRNMKFLGCEFLRYNTAGEGIYRIYFLTENECLFYCEGEKKDTYMIHRNIYNIAYHHQKRGNKYIIDSYKEVTKDPVPQKS